MKEKDCISLEIRLPANMEFIESLLSFIDAACSIFNLKKEDALKIRLASEKAVRNVIEHGLENNIKESFSVFFKHMPDRVEIIIKEKGMPFDFEEEIEIEKKKEKR